MKILRERLYDVWYSMKRRCATRNSYKKKGITVCGKWSKDFNSFFRWSISNGYSDGLTIDRINNKGNYHPKNCRWVTIKIQNRNTERNLKIRINGETKILKEWSEAYGICDETIRKRLKRGLTGVSLILPVKR